MTCLVSKGQDLGPKFGLDIVDLGYSKRIPWLFFGLAVKAPSMAKFGLLDKLALAIRLIQMSCFSLIGSFPPTSQLSLRARLDLTRRVVPNNQMDSPQSLAGSTMADSPTSKLSTTQITIHLLAKG